MKAFHPDLEADEELKLQKEDIMKQLTVAYENNDLHTLLRLEMEWLQKESNTTSKLTDDKLAIYNEVLKEQIRDLEMEIGALYDHPRYASLHRFANGMIPMDRINLTSEKDDLEQVIASMEELEPELTGPNAVKYVKEIIRSYDEEPDEEDFGDMFDEIFGRR